MNITRARRCGFGCGPRRLRSGGGVDGLLQNRVVGEIDLCLNFPGVRVVNVTFARACTGDVLTIDEVMDLTHEALSQNPRGFKR